MNLRALFKSILSPIVPLLLEEMRVGSKMPHRMFPMKRLSNSIRVTGRQIIKTIRHAAAGCFAVGNRRITHMRMTVRRMIPLILICANSLGTPKFQPYKESP